MESKLQQRVIKSLEKSGWYVLKVVASNKSGHPDVTAFLDGKTIFLELKDKNKKATRLQEYRHDHLRKLGFKVYVIDSWNDYQTKKL